MIRTIGQNPLAIRRIEHHVPQLAPLIIALYTEVLFGWIGQDPDSIHWLRQSRTGLNSWALILSDGREFHFRQGIGVTPSIYVQLSYQGAVKENLKTPDECRQFIRKLPKTIKLAAVV